MSTSQDSTITASPRFEGNTVFGTRPDDETVSEAGKVVFYGIGGRSNAEFAYIGSSTTSSFENRYYRSRNTDTTAAVSFRMYGDRLLLDLQVV